MVGDCVGRRFWAIFGLKSFSIGGVRSVRSVLEKSKLEPILSRNPIYHARLVTLWTPAPNRLRTRLKQYRLFLRRPVLGPRLRPGKDNPNSFMERQMRNFAAE